MWWGGKSTGRPESLVNAEDPVDHERMRKLLNPGFTIRALNAQEPLIQSYVDPLIQRLRELAIAKGGSEGAVVDIVQWYNFTTFDIIGDLGFGEPFGCLKYSTYHPWVATIFTHFKSSTFLASFRFYPLLAKLLMRCTSKSFMKVARENYKLAVQKKHCRLNLESEREDFMSPVIKYNDEKGMTISEIEGTFNTVIVTGSETTATVLSGITNYLIREPAVWERLVKEIRAFKDEKDISFANLKEVPCLNAVIHERLRMCPPTPAGLPRVIPAGGDTVCGKWFPGG